MKHWCGGKKFLSCLQLTITEQQHTWSGRRRHSGCRSHCQEQGGRLGDSSLGSHCLQGQESLGAEVACLCPSGCCLLRHPATGFCLWPWRHRWKKLCCSVWQWRMWRRCRCRWRHPEGSHWAPDRSARRNASPPHTTSHRCGRSWRRCSRGCCCSTGWMNTERPPIQRWESKSKNDRDLLWNKSREITSNNESCWLTFVLLFGETWPPCSDGWSRGITTLDTTVSVRSK